MVEQLLLVGNPNVGKSSLFNLLTGLRQQTANYDGVTVEKKVGKYKDCTIMDLPGIKSLWANSLDEQIAAREIIKAASTKHPILFVASGLNLEEDLLLFSQIADLQVPMALIINYKDELEANQIKVDLAKLTSKLGCPIILMNSRSGEGFGLLESIITKEEFKIPSAFSRSQYEEFEDDEIVNTYSDRLIHWLALGEEGSGKKAIEDLEQRHLLIHNILSGVVQFPSEVHSRNRSERMDSVLLHPVWGTLILLTILFLVFQAIFTFATYPMDWIDGFFGSLSGAAVDLISPAWLGDLIGNGILAGLGGILIFIPQIAILFFFFGILESSGYMSRISFLSDNVLKRFGLSGTSVVPLVSGLACAIPSIMSARGIKDEKERLAVILASPFMTCSARLPVYTILIALIFPDESFWGIFNLKGLALFGLYLLGTLMSLITALVISKIQNSKKKSMWILELPLYRPPHWKKVWSDMYMKTKSFVVDAGKFILIFSIILWFLSSNSPHSQDYIDEQYTERLNSNEYKLDPDVLKSTTDLEYSYSGYIGKFIEPAISPLGYDWKIGIALFSSFAAREVFVGTLSTLYSVGSEEESTIITRLKSEVIPETGKPRFSLATCISLLLFYAFALQCMSTVAIVRKETGSWKWPTIQFIAMLVLAYVAAFLGYWAFS